VELPAVNKMGWNTSTIHGLGRFLYLVLGILWLLSVVWEESYLREAQRQHLLINRTIRISLILAAVFGSTYLLLLLLS